jgi:hypothetical protein
MNKKNLILGGVLIVLIAVAYLYQGPVQAWKKQLSQPKNFLTALNIDNIDKIEIKQGKSSTILEKNSDRWIISGQKAFNVKKETMDELLQKLKDAKTAVLELVSTNKEKKPDFKLDASGIAVTLHTQDKQLKFIIGKAGSDFKSTYVTEDGADRSYLIPLSLDSLFGQADWRDKTIFNSDAAKISKLRYQVGQKQFVIEKKGEKWEGTAPKKFSVNQDKIAKITASMSELEAQALPEQIFKGTDLEKKKLIIQATGDGLDNTLMLGKANDQEQYYAKKGDSDNIFLISKEQFIDLNQNEASLK